MIEFIVGGAVAYVAGAFTPAVGRKIKALFVKEGNAVKVVLSAEAAKAKADLAAEVAKLAPDVTALVAKAKALLASL